MKKSTLKLGCLLCFLLLTLAPLKGIAENQGEADAGKKVKVKVERPEKEAGPKEGPEAGKTGEVSEKEGRPAEAEKTAAESGKTEKEKNISRQMKKEAEELLGNRQQIYTRKGRLDPFAPFVHGSHAQSQDKTRKKLKRREPQTELERISLGQLQLTAVMETPEERIGLVEDSSGKGYIVRRGTYIGEQGGRITKILPEAIVIEEKYLDVFGKVAVRNKQLKLQK